MRKIKFDSDQKFGNTLFDGVPGWCTFQIFYEGLAGSEDFACATFPTTPLDFQGKV